MIKQDLDIVFLGGLFPKETESDIRRDSIGTIDNAANNLQWSLVRGLDDNLKDPVTIINSLYIGSYPQHYKKMFISGYAFSHCARATDYNAGFFNLTGIKHFSRMRSVRPYLRKWAEDGSGKTKVVVAYALTSVFVDALSFIKGAYPDVLTIIVVPDLPQYMDTTNRGGLAYRLLKTLSMRHIMLKLAETDGFVLLTAPMAEALGLKNKKTVVVEGIANDLDFDPASVPAVSLRPTIAYTGTLNERYGVRNLVNAFMQIDDPYYQLVLCGSGDSEEFIRQCCRTDKRIDFRGLLTRDEIVKVQTTATILVNPRQNNEEFTKYSFPSKIMEYLSSGRPVVAYKLDGIPAEYDPHLFYVEDDSVGALRDKIEEVCSQPVDKLNASGSAARGWVLQEKNAVLQTRKIINMISDMLAGGNKVVR